MSTSVSLFFFLVFFETDVEIDFDMFFFCETDVEICFVKFFGFGETNVDICKTREN